MLNALRIWRSKFGHYKKTEDGDNTRTIFIDVSVLALEDAGTGIQRVVRAVYSHMQSMQPIGWRVIPVVATKRSPYAALPTDFRKYQAQPILKHRQTITPQAGDIFLGLDLAAHILPLQRRQVERWRQKGVRCCFVVYDLLPHTNPDWFRLAAVRNFRRWLKFIIKNGDGIIAISEHVCAQVVSVRARGVISGVGDGVFRGGACPTPECGVAGGHRVHRYGGVCTLQP